MSFSMAMLAQAFTGLLALIISLTFHEAAHAFAAKWQGDDTAEREGRLTFNPIPHIDPIGTIFLPFAAVLFHIPILLGWAKPVPVNPNNFRDRHAGPVYVAAAGPAANLALSALCLIALYAQNKYLSEAIPPGSFFHPFIELLSTMVWLNAVLAVFNLIPLPPLDGGTVLLAFLPRDAKEFYEDNIVPYGSFLLLALLFTGGLGWITTIAKQYVAVVQAILNLIF